MLRLRDFRRTTQPRDPNTRQFSIVNVRKSFQIEPELSGVIGILDRGPEPCIDGRPTAVAAAGCRGAGAAGWGATIAVSCGACAAGTNENRPVSELESHGDCGAPPSRDVLCFTRLRTSIMMSPIELPGRGISAANASANGLTSPSPS